DATMTANTADAYLKPAEPSTGKDQQKNGLATGRLDRLIGHAHVVIVQPTSRAKGHHVVYTTNEDKYVLTANCPSSFDAERATGTGDSLTFYKRDDRVLVEGEAKSPAVTKTRVVR